MNLRYASVYIGTSKLIEVLKVMDDTPVELKSTERKACVYFDGACPICAREIEAMRVKTKSLEFRDIHSENHLPERKDVLLRDLHLVKPDGSRLIGLDANLYMWRHGGLKWLSYIMNLPGIYALAKKSYSWWSQRRYRRLYT